MGRFRAMNLPPMTSEQFARYGEARHQAQTAAMAAGHAPYSAHASAMQSRAGAEAMRQMGFHAHAENLEQTAKRIERREAAQLKRIAVARGLQTGAKGGQYYISSTGQKVYPGAS